MAGVSGSSEAAAELKTKSVSTARALVELQSGFKRSLNILSASTHDESYEEAQYYCTRLETELRTLLPDISTVAQRLDSYIQFIERIELKISSGAPYGSGVGIRQNGGAAGAARTSREVWQITDTGCVYDSPEKTGKNMRHLQPRGDCGMCAIENLTIMQGKHINLTVIEDYANRHKLCGKDGGTSFNDRKDILAGLGIDSHLEDQSVEGIAAAVASGRGVIISVNSSMLRPYGYNGIICLTFEPHALLVTSVVTDTSGKVTDLFVCDSNSDSLGLTGAIKYSVQEIRAALIKNRKMNVTNDPVR